MAGKSNPQASAPNSQNPNPRITKDRDFLLHLEAYLAKRDGIDKLLKISRYASKIVLASSILPDSQSLPPRLKSFESSVGLSRKAFRLGKFVQDINALRASGFSSGQDVILSIIAYGGEGLYYFVEQFVWLAKAGLIDKKNLISLQKMSAWCEFIGYIGSISLKVKELRRIDEDEACLVETIKISEVREIGCGDELKRLKKLKEKKLLKRLSVVQDLADGLMALADIRDGKGRLSAPLLISSAGLLSAIISTHKNWISC
ncbi:OLC1v1017901C1 [Oldenlandia corymbosa var. corymbosa]|uniref:OLC1v1017901C1 n=1 Tax=Oldenlandia corymbosa var. corymbosa TaxID=529605 RepID=A0AAV1EAE6_OLDCO|nr:OLC1v1017901C1 [Oldenlandia corymbosa var. corymbosa]